MENLMTFTISEGFLSKAKLITVLTDGSSMVFAKGRFDAWCIYQIRGKTAYAIKDVDAFRTLEKYTVGLERFSLNKDFLYMFDMVTKVINYDVVERIKFNSKKYFNQIEIEYIYIFLYAGMIAEENKVKAILKKFIKRLGVHQVLIEKHDAVRAANYSKGRKWQELKLESESRGFYSKQVILKLSA
jgi:hypothetical protein